MADIEQHLLTEASMGLSNVPADARPVHTFQAIPRRRAGGEADAEEAAKRCGEGCSKCCIAMIIVPLLWLILRPSGLKVNVVDAVLREFNLVNNTLGYDLALNVTTRNPNNNLGINYERIEVDAYYKGQRFSTIWLMPFYQGHKNTSVLDPVFAGQSLVVLKKSGILDYDKERANGVFKVDLTFDLRITFKLGKFFAWFNKGESGRYKPEIHCALMIPLASSNGISTTAFHTQQCKVDSLGTYVTMIFDMFVIV